jgi:hypothetical protein
VQFKILHTIVISALCLGYLATVPMPAHAQDTDTDDRWKFKAAIYLWGAGIDGTTRRGNEFDVSFSDIISNLDLAFMGAFEARKSKWSLVADVVYLDVSADKAGTIGATGIPVSADVDVTGWVLNFQGARNVLDAAPSSRPAFGTASLALKATSTLPRNGTFPIISTWEPASRTLPGRAWAVSATDSTGGTLSWCIGTFTGTSGPTAC